MKEVLKLIPGFGTTAKWKMIIAIIYYILSLAMLKFNLGAAVLLLAIPFSLFNFIEGVRSNKIPAIIVGGLATIILGAGIGVVATDIPTDKVIATTSSVDSESKKDSNSTDVKLSTDSGSKTTTESKTNVESKSSTESKTESSTNNSNKKDDDDDSDSSTTKSTQKSTSKTTEKPAEKQYVNSKGRGLIKADINSKKEKLYYVPGGKLYDDAIAEKWYKTESEAKAAGYKRAEK